MKTVEISSEQDLQELLAGNDAYVNGKNLRVTDLYATAARSRFEIENIYGIYLTRPAFAWMALWMAVTDRDKVRKRHLRYQAPRGTDRIGRLSIGGLKGVTEPAAVMRATAFMYLFDQADCPSRILVLSSVSSDDEKVSILTSRGYVWKDIERRGEMRRALVPPDSQLPAILELDAWQVAVVQRPRLFPSAEIKLTGQVIEALAGRVDFQDDMPGSDYLRP